MIRLMFCWSILFIGNGCCGSIPSISKSKKQCVNPLTDTISDGKIKVFVGYKNEFPVFDCPDIHTLFIYKDKLEILSEYKHQYSVLSVDESIICYKEGSVLIIQENDIERKVTLNTNLPFITSNEKSVFYTDLNTSQIAKITKDNIKDIGISGLVIDVVGDYLYYSKESDSNLMYANADIYKVNISTFNYQERLVVNVSGENTFIIPDGKYIYDYKHIDNAFKPVIYKVDDNKFYPINIELMGYESTPFYSFERKCLVFYNSENMALKYVELP